MRLLLLISVLALAGCASTAPKKPASTKPAVQASTSKTAHASKPKTSQASKPKTAQVSKPPTALASKSQATQPPKPPAAHAKVETGQASFYSSKHHGQPTASGELYDETQLTAAHRTLPFGTRVRVTNLDNQRSAVFRINDRGPFIKGRVVDVSKRGAFELGFIQEGIAAVRVEVVDS